MNILTDKLPDCVIVSGRSYSVYTDFRIWIDFELAVLNSSLAPEKKIVRILRPYKAALPPAFDEAVEALVGFYTDGNAKAGSEGGPRAGAGYKGPVYSFLYDAEYIYAAFWAQYGIDLTTACLHWRQFKALFRGLDDTNRIMKIIEYRSIDTAKIKDAEQKKFYRRMKSLYALPDMRSEEEKERDMVRELEGLF